MYFRISNAKEYNKFVSAILSGFKKVKKNSQSLDRRDIERTIAPAISNGKVHDVVIAELKKQPKTCTGLVAKHATKNFADNLTALSTQVALMVDYQQELKAMTRHMSNFFKDKQAYYTDNYPVGSSVRAIVESLCATLNLDDCEKHISMSVDGLDEPCDIHGYGSEDFRVNFEIKWADNSLTFECDIESGDLDGKSATSITDIKLNITYIEDLVEYDRINFGRSGNWFDDSFERIEYDLMMMVEHLLNNSLTDMCGEIDSKVSPALMQQLMKELA